jgi:hypothetical protein
VDMWEGVFNEMKKGRPNTKVYLEVHSCEDIVKYWSSEINGLLEE